MGRRPLLWSILGAAMLAEIVGASEPGQPNPVKEENRNSGSTDWQLTRVKLDKGMASFRTSRIEGY